MHSSEPWQYRALTTQHRHYSATHVETRSILAVAFQHGPGTLQKAPLYYKCISGQVGRDKNAARARRV